MTVYQDLHGVGPQLGPWPQATREAKATQSRDASRDALRREGCMAEGSPRRPEADWRGAAVEGRYPSTDIKRVYLSTYL